MYIYLYVYVHMYVSVIIRLVIADIQLLHTSSANGEWQTVILQDWIKYWNVVCMYIFMYVHIYVCMYYSMHLDDFELVINAIQHCAILHNTYQCQY